MQTANQQNNSSLTPLSDPGSASSSSSTQIQQNCLNENIGQQHSLNYPPHQIQYLLANLLARNSAASNPNLAAIVANMQLTNLPPPPDLRLTPAFNLAALQLLLRNAAASNNQINTSGLLLRQHGNSANIVGYPQIKEENVSTGTDSLERHLHQQQILYGDKCEDEEKFLVDPSIVMEEDEEDEEEGQEENENIVKTQQEHQLENIKTTQQQTPVQQRRPRVGGSSAKTAEVWRFFSERPNGEKAATCSICQKTIKATNSSTTGMIRHLKSCHKGESELLDYLRFLKNLKNVTDDSMREKLLLEFSILKKNNPQLKLKEKEENTVNSGFIQTSEFLQKQSQTFNFCPKQHSVETLITVPSQYSPNISSSIKSNNSSGIGSSLYTSDIDTSSFSSLASPSDLGESSAFNQANVNAYGTVNSASPNEQQQQTLSAALLSVATAMLRNTQSTQNQQQNQHQFQETLNQVLSIPSKKAKRVRTNGTALVQSDLSCSSVQSTPIHNNTIKRKGAHVNDILQKLSNKAAAVTNSSFSEIKKESEEVSEYSSTVIKKGEKKRKQKRTFVSVQTQTDDIFEFERNEKFNSDKNGVEDLNGLNEKQ